MDVKTLQPRLYHSNSTIYSHDLTRRITAQHSAVSPFAITNCYAAKIKLTERPALARNMPIRTKLSQPLMVNVSPVQFVLPNKDKRANGKIKFYASKSICDLPNSKKLAQNRTDAQHGKKQADDAPSKTSPKSSNLHVLEGLPKPVEIAQKPDAKRRPKSNRRRKKSRSSRSSRRGRNRAEVPLLPIKKDLSSCFPLYSDNANRQTAPKAVACSSSPRSSEHYDQAKLPLCRSACEPRHSGSGTVHNFGATRKRNQPLYHSLQVLSTNTAMPPSIEGSKSCEWRTTDRGDSVPGGGWANEQQVTEQDNHGISLQPRPPRSQDSDNSGSGGGKKMAKPTARKMVLANPDQKHANTTKSLEMIYAENSLSGRLSLIHHYGTDYHVVAQRAAEQKKKMLAQQQTRTREVLREAEDKQKREQRKKIYALNRLMTALEMEQFKEYIKSIHGNH